jgi:hypothetical protein
VNARPLLASLAGCLLLLGVASGAGSQSEGRSDPLGAAWSRPVRGVIALAVSPEGQRALSCDGSGRLRCYDEGGGLLWERVVPDADTVVTGRNGALTLAYAARQPLSPQVSFLDDTGRRFYVLNTEEPVQRAVIARSGRFAIIAAGSTLYFWSRRPDGIRVRQARLEGPVQQLQCGPADSAYVVLQSPPGVQLVKSTGEVLWRRAARNVGTYSISASGDGGLLAIANERAGDWVDVTLVTARNQMRWTSQRQGRGPWVRLCPSGSMALLAFENKLEHNGAGRFQRSLAAFTGSEQGWVHGGVFSVPLYVSVDRDGEWLVVLQTQRNVDAPYFQLLGRGFDARWRYRPPAGVLITTPSADGRHIAIYRTDGILEMLRVATP